jgi:hypothetical protein
MNSKEFAIFKDGGPEGRIKWLIGNKDIEASISLMEPLDMSKIIRKFLKVRALSHFENHLRKRLCSKDIEVSDTDLLEIVM